MAQRLLQNGFRVGAIVRAEGVRPPGDGFILVEGEVCPNSEGGYYHDSPNVVLVRGPITSLLSSRRVRSRDTLEERGVYFHVKDVSRVAPGKGHPVTEQNAALALIADVLEQVAEGLSHPEQLASARMWGQRAREQADRIRELADGNR